MSCNRSPLRGEEGSVQEFQFDGAYAGAVSPRKEAAGSTKRQPKRRGLWACFAQPRADESTASSPLHTSPSRLTLTSQQLAFRSWGSQEEQVLPISSIKDVQFKWIQAGGVRVSKVTLSLGSGKEAVVIRGLKDPEQLVDAVRKRQQAAVTHAEKSPDLEARRSCGPPRTSPTGRWSEPAISSPKRVMITPRALFADGGSSPASAANSGCGSMTLMSAFARSPAQDFAGAESVAREIQLASPCKEDLSYSSSSDSTVHEVVTMTTRQASVAAGAAAAVATAGARLTSRALPLPSVSSGVRRTMLPPPRQASDSFALPPYAMLHLSVAAAAQPAPTVGRPGQSDDLAVEGLALRTAPGPTPPRAEEDLACVTTTRMKSDCSPLLGGSPPPRAEDSIQDGASVPASVAGSPRLVPSCTAGGNPPPVPEDSVVVYAAGGDEESTPVSPLSSRAACLPISPCAGGAAADPSCAALLGRLVQAARPARLGSDVVLEPLPAASTGATASNSGSGDSGRSPAETSHLLSTSARQRQNEGGHQLVRSSLSAAPPAPRAAGDGLSEEPAESVRPSGGSSFQSATSGELTDGSSSASPPNRSAEPALALASTSGPAPGLGAFNMQDRRATSPVGALGIAAVSATVSAVLTSAATASLGAVGLAAMPPTAGAASSTAVVAAASVGAAPLTLLGLAAAAAVTLVAAAAVTHIRTGSPLRPLQAPYDLDPWGTTAAHAEPLLSARSREGAGQVPESPASWFGGDRGCEKSAGNTGPASVGCLLTDAGADLLQAAVVTATPAGDEPVSAAALIGAVSRACTSPTPDLAAEPSLRCGPSNDESAGEPEGVTDCKSPATGASGTTAGSGEGSEEDGATSGAWGSQPTLVEFEAEHQASAGGSAMRRPARPSLGGVGSGGGAAAAAREALGLGEQEPQQQHSEADEEPLPVMLFSEGPGGMPPVSRIAEPGVGATEATEVPNAPNGQLPEQSAAVRCLGFSEGATCLATIAGHVGMGGASDGRCAHPAEHEVDGGELRPPAPVQLLAAAEPAESAALTYGCGPHRTVQVCVPSQPAVTAHRDPTVRQLFPDDDPPAYPPAYVPAPSGSSAQWRHQQQQQEQLYNQEVDKDEAAHSSHFGVPPPLAAAGIKASSPLQEAAACSLSPSALTQGAASSATQRRRAQHLTESPVRVLYSVHAAFTGLSPGAPVQWAVPVFPTSESAVQTEAPVTECAVQTEARGGVGADSRSETGTAVRNHGSSSGNSAAVAAQSLEESATQRVFTLNSPEESGNGESPGAGHHASVSVAAGPDDPEADASPPQVGARDWYMSSLGADAALGGFELAAAASRGGARDAMFESPSTADSSAYSLSPSPQGVSTAAAQPSVEGFGSGAAGPRAIAHQLACFSITRSQPAGEPSRFSRVATPEDGGCASATTNDEKTPLLGRGTQDSRRGNATAQSAVHQLSPALRSLLGIMRPTCPAAPVPGSSTGSTASSPSMTGSSAPESGSVGSGLYTPMMSDTSGSGAKGAAATALSRGDSLPSSSSADYAAEEGGTGAQRLLLEAGLPLSAEPLTPWTAQASSPSILAASGGTGLSSASSAQNRSFPETLRAGNGSAVTVEPPSSRSAVSDAADDTVWLLGPEMGTAGATDDGLVSAPGSPRIPPPPPLAHSSTTSRGGSTISHRITAETVESLGGAAGCCSSRRSSNSSCCEQGTAAAAAADCASLAWLVARGSVIRSAAAKHRGIALPQAGPVPNPCLDGNQLAMPQLAGACALAAERAAAPHVPGLHARQGGSESSRSSSGTSLSDSCSRTTYEGSTAGALRGPEAMCAVDSAPGVGVRGCSCSGNGSDSAIAASSQMSSPAPHSHSGASTAGSRAAAPSPELSDISSAAYAAGAYVYGSPYSSLGADTPGGPRAGPDARGASADGGAGDDLFQNPLYSTRCIDAADKSPRLRPPRDSSGCIALPLMPYSDGAAYGGGTTTTTTTDSPETVSAEPRAQGQPTVVLELPAGAGRRRTREEAGVYFNENGDGLQRIAGVQYGARTDAALRAEDMALASRHGSADGAGEPYSGAAAAMTAATAAAASLAGGALGVSKDGLVAEFEGIDNTGGEVQPLKRARTQVPQADVASCGLAQQQQLLCTPAHAPGTGGTAPPRGLPLVSPLMVLNPTYAQSAGGSPGMNFSQPAAPSNDVSVVRAGATPRHGGGSHWSSTAAVKSEAAGGDSCAALVVVEQLSLPLQITPRNRDLAQLQKNDWEIMQGSPSSQQAVNAAALLRSANDAVDFAREAVQRGDAQWLSRVTATLQAVQSALDALRDF